MKDPVDDLNYREDTGPPEKKRFTLTIPLSSIFNFFRRRKRDRRSNKSTTGW